MAHPALGRAKRTLKTTALPLLHAGNQVECPVCQGRFARFAGRYCPRCQSPERQRFLWMYLEHTGILDPELAVLHIAPEAAYRERLRHRPVYVAGDLNPEGLGDGLRKLDVTDLPFPDGTFDRAIVNHVFEHVPDDRKAMSELHRVLKPGGRLIAQHPVKPERVITDEDPSVTDERERIRRFGQRDHVRAYGQDIDDRLRGAGFKVRRGGLRVAAQAASLYGLERRRMLAWQVIHDCSKPHRAPRPDMPRASPCHPQLPSGR